MMDETQPEALRLASLLLLSGALPGSISECAGIELRRQHARITELEAWQARAAQAAPSPATVFCDEDYVAVPRGLIGAACSAIEKKRDSVKTLAELRRYTVGDLSAPHGAATPSDADLLAVIRDAARGSARNREGTTSLRIARAVLARWGAPQAVGQPLQQAHRLGFLRAAGWAQRDDLFADVDSPAYKKDQAEDLGRIKPPQQIEPVPLTDEQICDIARTRCHIDLNEQHEIDAVIKLAKAVEDHHGITGKPEGSQP